MHNNSPDILCLDYNSIALVFEFLHFRDAIKICILNKKCYTDFIILCYKHSFVPLDLKKNS